MANSIALAKKYAPLLDEVYKLSSLTSVLESDNTLAREGANANEIIVPKISMDGLGAYSRNSGYVSGSATLAWETVAFNYERGRKFMIDDLDNEETQGIAFGKLASEFIRTKVAPELDAFRFATICGVSGVGKVGSGATLSTASDVIAAIRAGVNIMDEAEVPAESRFLFITPTLFNLVEDVSTTTSKAVLDGFKQIVKVPQSRFYTQVTLYDGTTSGQEAGGYVKTATTGKDLNFMLVEKSAIAQYTKHAVPKIIAPKDNHDADAWIYAYRNNGLCDVYENKVTGVYYHHKA